MAAGLEAGSSFATQARRHSRDTKTRDRGGLLTLVEGRTAPALDRVAFSLATGAVSPPFHTQSGWELVQAVTATRPSKTTPFAAVREAIRRKLLAQGRDRDFPAWLASVREEFAPRTAYARRLCTHGRLLSPAATLGGR